MNHPRFIYYNDFRKSINMVLDIYVKNKSGEINPVVVAITPDTKGKYNNVDIDTNAINTIFDYEGYETDLDLLLDSIIWPKGITKKELLALKKGDSAPDYEDSSSTDIISDSEDNSRDSGLEYSVSDQNINDLQFSIRV